MNQFMFYIETSSGRRFYGTIKAQDGRAARERLKHYEQEINEEIHHCELFGVQSKTFSVKEIEG